MTATQKNNLTKISDNISVTAYRTICILNLLLNQPSNEEEISTFLKEQHSKSKNLSSDTIYIYLNTLKAIGCQICRPCKTNNHKYILKNHPFMLKLDDPDLKALIQIRKYISNLKNWKFILEVEKLFDIIQGNLILDSEKKFERLRNTSLRYPLTQKIIETIEQLESHAESEDKLEVVYTSPVNGVKKIKIKPEEIFYENGAFYVHIVNLDVNQAQYLRVDRINSFELLEGYDQNISELPEIEPIQYRLKGASLHYFILGENESIISKTENEMIIEEKITNKFKFYQKVLSYGDDCTIIKPLSFQKEMINKLETMLEIYK